MFGHEFELYPFAAFTAMHWLMIGLFAAGSVAIILVAKVLQRYHRLVRSVFFIVLFILEAGYHYWLYNGNNWDVRFTLPLQLCSISLLLSLILLASDWRPLFQPVYFLGIAGAVQAILTPELFYGFPHFRYWQFFITHMLIIWTALFYFFAKNERPTHKGLWISFLFLNASAGVAAIANKIVRGNYMFLAQKPDHASLLDYLGPYPWYIFSMEVIALFLFYLLYIPARKRKSPYINENLTNGRNSSDKETDWH